MPDFIHYELNDRVAVLTIDNPPVNALGQGVWEAIDEAVARAAGDAGADAMVLIGAGKTFVAGADINIFRLLKTREQSLTRSAVTHAMLSRLEDSPKPLVAAIHGQAFGGGLELAMACHYRVATMDAMIGQPEVLLGIIPGAGGTQRLPRLTAAPMVLKMCTDGKAVPAPTAHAAGIIDEIVEGGLLRAAIGFAKTRAEACEIRRTRAIVITPEQSAAGLEACQQAREHLGRTMAKGPAPHAAVNAVEAAMALTFDAGSVRE